MKYILSILAFCLLPSMASAGLLFGDRVTIYNGTAPSSGYTVRYGYSDSFPSYRTYRVYRRPVVTYSVGPQVGYAVPAPAPVAAPADAPQDPAPVYRSVPVQSYYAVDDVAVGTVTRIKHREKHKHGKHKVSHKETSRD